MTMTRSKTLFAAIAVALLMSATSQAELIVAQFTGLDVRYDGSTVEDGNPVGDDLLDTATLQLDGVNATGSPFVSDISIDFSIPSVLNIPVGGGSVTSAAGGTLDLNLPGGDFVSLTLDEVTITYIEVTSSIRFAFAAADGSVVGQSLPDGLLMTDPVEVSFSTNVQSLMDDGTYITSFTSRGTGELESENIPEPTTAVMGLLALVSAAAVGMRSRLG